MDVLKRLIRIYRFFILSLFFCLILSILVSNNKFIYQIIYFIPSPIVIFYPIYSVFILFFDLFFITDYLYYYINPTNEISLRVKKSYKYVLKKIIFCLCLLFLKILTINIIIFNSTYLLPAILLSVEELLMFLIINKLFNNLSLDRLLIIIILLLMIIKQFLNPLII